MKNITLHDIILKFSKAWKMLFTPEVILIAAVYLEGERNLAAEFFETRESVRLRYR